MKSFIKNNKRLCISILIFWVVLLGLLASGQVIQVLQGTGPCMEPILDDNDILIVWRLCTPKIGDIITVDHNGLAYTKRLAKTEGNKLWILGDNADNSDDSNDFGWVDGKNFIGKVVLIIKH
jgi:phage repressor protein C with HTH and peptisase S24 domain